MRKLFFNIFSRHLVARALAKLLEFLCGICNRIILHKSAIDMSDTKQITFFYSFLLTDVFGSKAETNMKFLSSQFPSRAIAFPIVKAANTVLISNPSIWPRKSKVIAPVIIKHITSKGILILEYGIPVIADNSRGNKSVGIIGILKRLESAMPKLITK